MIKNYLTVAIRNIARNKTFSAINIVGLAIGLASCILILLFVQRGFRMNRSHEKADRIYRVIQETYREDKTLSWSSGTPGALGPALKSEFPEVQEGVRILKRASILEGNGKTFTQTVSLVDKSLFDVFTFPFLKGDRQTALRDPKSIVLTESTAKQFFDNADPMGQIITIYNRQFRGDYLVTGILKDLPRETTLRFDVLVIDPKRSASTRRYWEEWAQTDNIRPVENYVLLPESYDPKILERKLHDFALRHLEPEEAKITTYHLQPFVRIYLYSYTDYGVWWDGIGTIYPLSAIAAFVLLLACINFANLSTARSAERAKEVGLRKVVGAHRLQLICQFLGETLLMASAALLVALGLVELLMPSFNDLIRGEIKLTSESFINLLPSLICITLLAGLLAGSYPAFFLSTYQPVETLKRVFKTGGSGAWLRKGLVVFQFSISVFLIISTFAVHNQITFMLNQNLGFDPTRIILLPIFKQNQEIVKHEERLSNQYEQIKAAFLQNPNIQKATAFRLVPIINGPISGGIPRRIRPEGLQEEQQIPINEVDETFFDTFGIELVIGRTFSPGRARHFTAEFIINETTAKQFGWKNPIGKQIEWVGSGSGTVVGMVKDYHFSSLKKNIGPQIFARRTSLFTQIGLKIREGDLTQTRHFLEKIWKQFVPTQAFEYALLEENINRVYWDEQRWMKISGISSVLTILIASLGLFGLASFTAQRRIKEIGIRKVLGASVSNLVLMLSKEFALLVGLANLIAWPIVYYAMNRWLQDFAYRIDLGIWAFVLSGFLALFIALTTVSYQAWKVARTNPVDALRYE